MPRRLNYTNRQRVLREHIDIRIVDRELRLAFEADLDLGHYAFEKFSPRPRVYVEAYRGGTASWKRFDFGRVGEVAAPEDTFLEDFRVADGVLFRVRISATMPDGAVRLVGEADAIHPRRAGEEKSPVQPIIQHLAVDDIGDELWRVDFSGELPLLKINDRLAGGVDQFLLDPKFRSIFAPAVVRQVLGRILLVEQFEGDEEDEGDWRQRWLRFGELMAGKGAPDALVDEERIAAIDQWIDFAVEGFARRAELDALFEGGGCS